jgi:hypothetical protein
MLLFAYDTRPLSIHLPSRYSKGMGTWRGGALCCNAAVQGCDPPDPVLCNVILLKITIDCPCLTMIGQSLTIFDQSILKYGRLALQQAATCQQICI